MSSSCAWYKLFEIRKLIFHIGNPTYAIGVASWLGLFNSDEIFPACNNLRGANGCTRVLQQRRLQVKGKTYVVNVDHTNEIDQVCREHEPNERTALLIEY